MKYKIHLTTALIFATITIISLFYKSPAQNNLPSQTLRVVGDSMWPIIKSGAVVNHILGYYASHVVQKNDIVIFRSSLDKNLIIKRVIAVPGDKLELKDWSLFVNDELSKNLQNIEYEFRSEEFKAMVSMMPIVPEKAVLLMGEPRKGALDSSRLGFISTDDIVSRVISD